MTAASSLPHQRSILLVYPPVAKPCEPPAGIMRLADAVKAAGVHCRVHDANLAGLLHLLRGPAAPADTWTRRAVRHVEEHLDALKQWPVYGAVDRYKRAVLDINRVLHEAGGGSCAEISLSNFTSRDYSPVRSQDLLRAAEAFEKNPFHAGFAVDLANFFFEKIPEIVGFSVNFMSQAVCAFAMAGFIRKNFPRTHIVMGGGLVTSWMHIPGFINPFGGLVDDLVAGPGEGFLLNLCGEALPEGPAMDFPPEECLPVSDYLAPGPVLPIAASRGCYWRKCAFCPEKTENSGYDPESFENLETRMHQTLGGVRPSLIHFLDNALAPRFLKRLIARPPGAPWYGFARITPHLADPDFARALKASGCVMLKLGVESGDQKVLDALQKGIDLSTVSKALRNLKSAGIATYVYLLFGTPAEDPSGAEKTLAFTLSHSGAIDFLNLAVFNLPAYSADAANLATVDFYPGDLSLYREFVHPRGWNRDQVRRFLGKTFTKPAPIRAIVHHDPPFFTSNHAPFLVMGQSR